MDDADKNKKSKCEKLKHDLYLCDKIYNIPTTIWYTPGLCQKKFRRYIYECGNKEEKKNIMVCDKKVCSIYATH